MGNELLSGYLPEREVTSKSNDGDGIMGNELLSGYLPEREVAAQREISLRTLRLERQRGNGPPYVKTGRRDAFVPD